MACLWKKRFLCDEASAQKPETLDNTKMFLTSNCFTGEHGTKQYEKLSTYDVHGIGGDLFAEKLGTHHAIGPHSGEHIF
eukprot:3894672-Amphidinium_carterae.1